MTALLELAVTRVECGGPLRRSCDAACRAAFSSSRGFREPVFLMAGHQTVRRPAGSP